MPGFLLLPVALISSTRVHHFGASHVAGLLQGLNTALESLLNHATDPHFGQTIDTMLEEAETGLTLVQDPASNNILETASTVVEAARFAVESRRQGAAAYLMASSERDLKKAVNQLVSALRMSTDESAPCELLQQAEQAEREQLRDYTQAIFSRLDRNNSGDLDRAEFHGAITDRFVGGIVQSLLLSQRSPEQIETGTASIDADPNKSHSDTEVRCLEGNVLQQQAGCGTPSGLVKGYATESDELTAICCTLQADDAMHAAAAHVLGTPPHSAIPTSASTATTSAIIFEDVSNKTESAALNRAGDLFEKNDANGHAVIGRTEFALAQNQLDIVDLREQLHGEGTEASPAAAFLESMHAWMSNEGII